MSGNSGDLKKKKQTLSFHLGHVGRGHNWDQRDRTIKSRIIKLESMGKASWRRPLEGWLIHYGLLNFFNVHRETRQADCVLFLLLLLLLMMRLVTVRLA